MTERIKMALIIAAAIVLAAWIQGITTKNAHESCVEHLREFGRNEILCAPGLAR